MSLFIKTHKNIFHLVINVSVVVVIAAACLYLSLVPSEALSIVDPSSAWYHDGTPNLNGDTASDSAAQPYIDAKAALTDNNLTTGTTYTIEEDSGDDRWLVLGASRDSSTSQTVKLLLYVTSWSETAQIEVYPYIGSGDNINTARVLLYPPSPQRRLTGWQQIDLSTIVHSMDAYGYIKFRVGMRSSTNGRTITISEADFAFLSGFDVPHTNFAGDTDWCVQCHRAHGGGNKSIFRPIATGTITPEESICLQCHDGAGSDYILSTQFAKRFRMPIASYDSRHTRGDKTKLRGYADYMGSADGTTGLNNRHVECIDCHNPHQDSPPAHIYGSNDASNRLKGVWGVVPTNGASWTDPVLQTTYQAYSSDPTGPFVKKEYELCFKCHSKFAYGNTPPDSPSFILGYNVSAAYRTSTADQTNMSKEFNPANASYHPVEAPGRNIFKGRYNNATYDYSSQLRSMDATHRLTPNSTLYCSDCHRAEATDITAVMGPHGSTQPFLLMGSWDANVNRDHVAFDDDTTMYPNHRILCFNCHNPDVFNNENNNNTGFRGEKNNIHAFHLNGKDDKPGNGPARCLNCHVGVVHGHKRDHLLATYQDVEPYRTPYSRLKTSDPWGTSGDWQKNDCDDAMFSNTGGAACAG